MKKIALVSHGCAKNLVDSELILGFLKDAGYEITLDETDSDIVVVNTCSFINDAEKESVDSIIELINSGKKVIVTGCLAQKYGDKLKELIPELYGITGATDFHKIVEIIKEIENGKDYVKEVNETPNYQYPENIERQQITVGSSSYIKIADGCNYRCGYCIIPYLRGDYHSRKIEDILKEANDLVSKGVTEIILIAQDTTAYGIDIYKKTMLAELLKELNKIKDLMWIRIMYAYPTQMTDELLDTIQNCEKVVKYIDIPLQHSHPEVLKRMNRPAIDYVPMIRKIREKIPNVAIRTAFIVGYPMESDEEFEHLYNFVKEMEFNKVGVFKYSREKGTPSYNMKPQISKKIIENRYDKLMLLQQEISLRINKSFIGKTLPCIIENFTDDGYVTARTQYDAPEVDGLVYIKTDMPVVPGDIENVKITDCDEYDLVGIIE